MGKKQAPSSEVAGSPYKKTRKSSGNNESKVPSISEMHSAISGHASKKRNDRNPPSHALHMFEDVRTTVAEIFICTLVQHLGHIWCSV